MKSLKNGKAVGIDDMPPEQIWNFGTMTKNGYYTFLIILEIR
jgi:hypothetical protein